MNRINRKRNQITDHISIFNHLHFTRVANTNQQDNSEMEIETLKDVSNTSFGENAAMDRVQSALKAQLLRTCDRIQRQVSDQQDEFRKARKKREDCGVELYGMQQQLAQVQNKLDDTSVQQTELISKRNNAGDEQTERLTERSTRISKKDGLKKKSSKRKEKLDEVNSALKQAKKFNQETKNEVAVTKRVASKAGETVKGTEKGKEAQDIYIDGLNQQLKQLETDTKWVNKQLGIQRKQTEETNGVIKEMAVDLEVLSSEKKQLVQQWNSAILALGRRDQALAAATKAVKKAQDITKDHESELTGLKRGAFNLSLEIDKGVFDRNRIESEMKFIEDNFTKAQSSQVSLAAQFEMMSKIISKTHGDQVQEDRTAKKHLSDVAALTHRIEAVSRERRELEDE